jgi:septal ring factor EnvC (AmiA/AmiB activator)
MKINFKLLLLAAVLYLIPQINLAQENSDNNDPSLDQGTIDSQFEYIFKKSGNFKGTNGQAYEAVKAASLEKLRSNVLDSLGNTYKQLEESQKTVEEQDQEIAALKASLADTKNTLDNTNKEKDSMQLFGIQMSKTNYNVLMWGIIATLIILLALFIYKFQNSNAVTKTARHKLSELEQEYEEHRKTALEREQKVRRQLQDEINKHKN